MADGVPLRIEPLNKEHDRTGFDCGVDALTAYLKDRALQDQDRRIASMFVLCEGSCPQVLGFYSLSAMSLTPTDLPEKVAKKLPRYPYVPAVLIGRLAVDRTRHKQGNGSILLANALTRIDRADIAAAFAVVDTVDENAKAFYLYHGFMPFHDHPMRLFCNMSTIKRILWPPTRPYP